MELETARNYLLRDYARLHMRTCQGNAHSCLTCAAAQTYLGGI